MDVRSSARAGGWAAVVAGVVGVAGAGVLLAVPPQVPEGVFSHPFATVPFAVVQSVFFLHHLIAALAVLMFWRAGLAGESGLARVGGIGSAAALALLGVWEVVVIGWASAPYPSDETLFVDVVYGSLSILTGVMLVLLGIAAARARRLAGVGRWIMLAIGVWVFVPMTPLLAAGFVAGRLGIGMWLLLFAVLGWIMLRWAARPTERRAEALRTAAAS